MKMFNYSVSVAVALSKMDGLTDMKSCQICGGSSCILY